MNYWIWFATLEKIGPIKKKKLLDKFKTPQGVFNASMTELIEVEGIGESSAWTIFKNKDLKLIKKYEDYIFRNNIKLINITDEAYPAKLKMIYDSPITLFCIGNTDLLYRKSIAIIGSRNPSLYGMKVANYFSDELSKNGIVIVSGLAKGIDAIGHSGTFNNGCNTIAVLGNGVDIVYPKENINIYNEISKNGLIISEYIVGTKPDAKNFPARNRIISGISNGVLVIEAKKKSGTIITTDFALEQGRDLYVVPGNITSENSEGTNNLIKEGAKVVTGVTDILEDLI